jgi:hypothetical protein
LQSIQYSRWKGEIMAIEIQPLRAKRFQFGIRGLSPYVSHAWSDKALAMLRMTAQERRKQPKVKRDPETEAMSSAYKTADGEFGFPLMAFKASIIGAAHKDLGLEKTLVRKALFLPTTDDVVPITYETMNIREDIVRVGINQTDIRYRCEFVGWSAIITADMDVSLLTPENLMALVNRAGFSVGIGERRPEKGGEWGRYEIDTTQELQEIAL